MFFQILNIFIEDQKKRFFLGKNEKNFRKFLKNLKFGVSYL